MNAPLTSNVALIFGAIGIVLVVVVNHFDGRLPDAPSDWDPYRWMQTMARLDRVHHRSLRNTKARWRRIVRRANRGARGLASGARAQYAGARGAGK